MLEMNRFVLKKTHCLVLFIVVSHVWLEDAMLFESVGCFRFQNRMPLRNSG